jgi:Uma2 family endonuclease
MIAQPQYLPEITPEEYLQWEAKQEYRNEYIDGEIVAMTGGTIAHTKIYLNLYRALYPHLSSRNCDAYVADVKVQGNKNSRYFYPDLVVTCDPEDLKASDLIKNPTVIVEVLSPSTANYDRTRKLKYYRQIPSLQEYILIDSESISVEIYRRGEGKMWLYCQYEAGEIVNLASLNFEIAIAQLYENVTIE